MDGMGLICSASCVLSAHSLLFVYLYCEHSRGGQKPSGPQCIQTKGREIRLACLVLFRKQSDLLCPWIGGIISAFLDHCLGEKRIRFVPANKGEMPKTSTLVVRSLHLKPP